jgi:streptogramin lyase
LEQDQYCSSDIVICVRMTPRAIAEDRGNSNREAAELFAVLPDGASGPEGLTVGPDGNVYVATFGFNSAGPVTGLGQL